MNLNDALLARIDKWKLLKHPFYQAWVAGQLPLPALQSYAQEYGAFISLMPLGWQTLEDAETVEEEQEHIELWQDFAKAFDTKIGDAKLPAIVSLSTTTRKLFDNKVTAMGALFAFEVQQPETASSKLEGLREFYDVPIEAEKYFIEHAKNHHESEKLLALIEGLSEKKQAQALAACEEMSQALWDALTDIHETHSMV